MQSSSRASLSFYFSWWTWMIRQDFYPTKAWWNKNHHSCHWFQSGDFWVQGHQLHHMGCGWPGQDQPPGCYYQNTHGLIFIMHSVWTRLLRSRQDVGWSWTMGCYCGVCQQADTNWTAPVPRVQLRAHISWGCTPRAIELVHSGHLSHQQGCLYRGLDWLSDQVWNQRRTRSFPILLLCHQLFSHVASMIPWSWVPELSSWDGHMHIQAITRFYLM